MSSGDLDNMIGPYHVIETIGHGGMSTVYKAWDADPQQVVAVKMLLPALVRDQLFRQRFAQEAQVVAALRHPHIVAIYGSGEHAGLPYLVMEYLAGPTLHATMRQRRQSGQVYTPGEALALLQPLCSALDYAHSQRIVHRDLKPENIICTTRGPVITDFGVAKLLQDEATNVSQIIGTPAYMAPEQIEGGVVDRRTDIYALGVLLYELFTGHVPFAGSTPSAVMHAHLHLPPPTFRSLNPQVQVSRRLEQVIQQAIAKRREDRWQTAAELAAALAEAAVTTVELVPRTHAQPRPRPALPRAERPAPPEQMSSGRLVMMVPLVALLIAVLLVAGVWARQGREEDAEDGPVVRVSATASSHAVAPVEGTPLPGVETAAPTRPAAVTATALDLELVVATAISAQPTVEASTIPTPAATPSPLSTPTPDGVVRGRVQAGTGAYVRSGPGTAYPIVAGLPNNAPFTAQSQSDGWLEIVADTGEQGWIATPLVAIESGDTGSLPSPPLPPLPPIPAPSATIAPAPPAQALAATIRFEDTDLAGGFRNRGASVYGGRTATWVYGQGSGYSTMSATIPNQPPRVGTATLFVEGMDSEDSVKTPMRIALNGVVLFEGACPFPNDDAPLETGVWAPLQLTFDAAILQPGANTVTLTNLASGGIGRPPFIAVDYMVVQLP